MNVTIGSLVLCYLLAPTTGTNQNNQQQEVKTIKVLGKVIDFQERDAVYDKDEKTPVAYIQKVDDFVIKGINRKGIYQVNVRACKPVEKIGKYEEVPELEEVDTEGKNVEVEIDEKNQVTEKTEGTLTEEQKEQKLEKIKDLLAEKKKQEDEKRKELAKKRQEEIDKQVDEDLKTEEEKMEEKQLQDLPSADQTPSQKEGQKQIEEKGIMDYLFEK